MPVKMDRACSSIEVSMTNHTQSEQNALKSDNEEKTEPAKKKPSLRLLD